MGATSVSISLGDSSVQQNLGTINWDLFSDLKKLRGGQSKSEMLFYKTIEDAGIVCLPCACLLFSGLSLGKYDC